MNLCLSAGAVCRKKKVFFHCDAAQAVGKVPIDVNDMKIDLMSISGHKIYGPKGCHSYCFWFDFLKKSSVLGNFFGKTDC